MSLVNADVGERLLFAGVAAPVFRAVEHRVPAGGGAPFTGRLPGDSLVVWFNLAGNASIAAERGETELGGGAILTGRTGRGATPFRRHAGQHHRWIALAWQRAGVAEVAGRDTPEGKGLAVRPMRGSESVLATEMVSPPVSGPGRRVWFEAKGLELLATLFLDTGNADAPGARRRAMTDHDRVDAVVRAISSDPGAPPTLAALGAVAGCSPFHLSRTFSRTLGMTIPQFVRKVRIERAAGLLAAGTHNVTEAAMEAGYSSLSHFSKAFCLVMGCCPCLYPRSSRRG